MDGGVDVNGPPPGPAVHERDLAGDAAQPSALGQTSLAVLDVERGQRLRRIAIFEQRDEREVGDHAIGVDATRLDVALPDGATITFGVDVAAPPAEHLEESVHVDGLAHLVEQVDGTRRVPEDLHRLDAREVVEEPAA